MAEGWARYRDFWVLLARSGFHRFFQEQTESTAGEIETIRQYKDVQEVHSIAGHLQDKVQKQELKAAA